MSGKYREILRGDVAPKTALEALKRKVDKQARSIRELQANEDARAAADVARAAAAAERPEEDLFVSRAELREALDTGEEPAGWTPLYGVTPADVAAGPVSVSKADPDA